MLDGRVKTLHPLVHGGLLYIRGNAEHEAAVAAHGIQPIDMVVVNLYAFEKTAAQPGVAFGHLIENIDIGGPSMVRSAAKNFEDVAIVTRVADYAALAGELNANNGALTRATRWRLAKQAFATTAAYDTAIANALDSIADAPEPQAPAVFDRTALPTTLRINMPLAQPLRYGENPHQRAALYSDGSGLGVAGATQLQGQGTQLQQPRRSRCLLGAHPRIRRAHGRHHQAHQPLRRGHRRNHPRGLPEGSRRRSRLRLRQRHRHQSRSRRRRRGRNRQALRRSHRRPQPSRRKPASVSPPRRISASSKSGPRPPRPVVKNVSGGLLLQDADTGRITEGELDVVTWRPPTAEELRSLIFAWRVCKHVKSNAIVYARDGQTVGIGAGQMSRVDAAKFGAQKAVLPLAGTVAASDAFFPFPDGLEAVAAAGATAVIQPGGSVKDQDVIAAADKLGLAMVFTGIRHFRH